MPLVNGNIQADSLSFATGDTLNPVAGGFSIATLNWKDSMALVLVHTSPARITALAKKFAYLGGDSVAVKDSVITKDGKETKLIDEKTEIKLPKDKGKITATSLQQVLNAYKIPVSEVSKVRIGAKVEAKPVEVKPIEVKK